MLYSVSPALSKFRVYTNNRDCAGRLRAWSAGKNESETGAESKSRSHSYVFKLETKMASGNPLITLERMLNGRTTLKTQKVTHTNIVCKYRYFLF